MIELLTSDFILYAYLAIILIGFSSSYFGVFVVQRKLSFLGNGLAHAAFGGVALGILLDTQPIYIAIPFTIFISLLITYFKEKSTLSSDTLIGVFFSFAFALGIIFLSLKETYTTDAFTYLFGSILSISNTDIIILSLIAIFSLITFFTYWSRWAYSTFDNELAIADRLPVRSDNYVLSVSIALIIVVSVKIIGIVLISSYLVLPAAIARLYSRTFFKMTILSIIIGILSGLVSIVLSVIIDLPTSAVIIVFQSSIFLVSLLIKKSKM